MTNYIVHIVDSLQIFQKWMRKPMEKVSQFIYALIVVQTASFNVHSGTCIPVFRTNDSFKYHYRTSTFVLRSSNRTVKLISSPLVYICFNPLPSYIQSEHRYLLNSERWKSHSHNRQNFHDNEPRNAYLQISGGWVHVVLLHSHNNKLNLKSFFQTSSTLLQFISSLSSMHHSHLYIRV